MSNKFKNQFFNPKFSMKSDFLSWELLRDNKAQKIVKPLKSDQKLRLTKD